LRFRSDNDRAEAARRSGETTTHQVVHGGPELIIESVDLTAPMADLLARIAKLSDRVLEMATEFDVAAAA